MTVGTRTLLYLNHALAWHRYHHGTYPEYVTLRADRFFGEGPLPELVFGFPVRWLHDDGPDDADLGLPG